ncbi:unnamed protein product [Spirodela intermedia]|uniref:Receptor-like serine/threonine-protein kinase n=1 Tax=Spirodela intermedia TaxID=51605 RepID=A0A7I8JF67_SPIIN|nr:unnamed protein product [Spirodela intermedia]CAA6668769.1 unnamed protein product [Spirodela intermedia]
MVGRQARREALFFAALFPTLITLSAARDTLVPGDRLEDGSSLVCSDGSFKLGFFTPGKSKFRFLGIWYNQIPVQTVVWVANRDNPLPDKTGVLSISINGSLSLSDSKGVVYWSTSPTRLAGPVAKLLDDANFAVGGAGEAGYVWQSFDHPTDAFLPGMKLWVDRRTGLTRNFTSWKSDEDPGTGNCTFFLDSNGIPQIFLVQGTKRLGVPGMRSYGVYNFSFVSNADEAYYLFSSRIKSMLTRLVAQPNGRIERLVWMEGEGKWNAFYSGPKDRCDAFGYCGTFGVCDAKEFPMCRCLQGFEPKSPENGNLRDGKDGCRRRTEVDCLNGTDGFVLVANVKLPDTSVAVVNEKMEAEECREACLRICSCTAYATGEMIDGSRSGCIIWSGVLTDLRVHDNGGQDLFVRLALADLVILGNYPNVKSQIWNQEITRSGELDLPFFDLAAIAAATDHFSIDSLLGEGGFGPVYKGRLEGKQVAVKRLAKSSSQGVEQFMNEVRLIAKLQHRNLVRLLGCCIDGEERMLVYEYMPNGSLDSLVFDKTKASLLDWGTRWRIIGGVARGLLYLHQDSRFRIIHRDLKAGNVLLDDGMNPKISDFGMARIFAGDETEGITRRIVGTYGYMSPEYAMDGSFSAKSDVFSFGVLVLELVSGRRNRGILHSDCNLNLLGYAWSLWKEGKGLELVDSLLGSPIHLAEVDRCIKIALLCVQDRPEDRPEMATVVLMLGGDSAAVAHPKQPEFVVARPRIAGCSTSIKGLACTVNDVTLSAVHGR